MQALAPAVAICLALLTACGGGPSAIVPSTSTPSAVTALPATAAAPTVAPATPIPHPEGLGEILWSGEPLTIASRETGVAQLTSDARRIVANVPAYRLPAGSQVSAAWSYNNTSLDAFATTLTVEQPQAEQWLTFQLNRNNETPWPTGVYEITISLNGQVAQSASIEVIS